MVLEAKTENLGSGRAVVSIVGSLTLGTNLKTVDGNLRKLVSEGLTQIVLDLSECPYCDSAGLGVLVHAHGLTAQHGGSLRLCNVGERVMDLLRMTHVVGILSIDADRQTSVDQLTITA